MHIATKSDWPDLKPMPASYEDMKIELHFNAAHMRNLRPSRGSTSSAVRQLPLVAR